tara:strand:+ start:1231 stop:1734 length:504 start_codon:yes stop_codon:yes gene_type:complete
LISHSPVRKRRRLEEGHEVDGDDCVIEEDSTLKDPPPKTSELQLFEDILSSGDAGTLHEVMIKSSTDRVCEYEIQGSVFCNQNCCLLDVTKKEKEPVHKVLKKIGENVSCGKKGACTYGCVGACRRLAAYQSFAKHIDAKGRTVLPTCVRVYINALYGSSVVGFKKQ